jgi:hypothetical protein
MRREDKQGGLGECKYPVFVPYAAMDSGEVCGVPIVNSCWHSPWQHFACIIGTKLLLNARLDRLLTVTKPSDKMVQLVCVNHADALLPAVGGTAAAGPKIGTYLIKTKTADVRPHACCFAAASGVQSLVYSVCCGRMWVPNGSVLISSSHVFFDPD